MFRRSVRLVRLVRLLHSAECLNTSWFLSMEYARERIEAWSQDYNHYRPRSALGGLTPAAFAADAQKAELRT